ncbi:MAG: hypothetical protein A2Y33_07465 [Spirochaetes bacterium GWF1_51_8]|nr:MAG: hypothetical protein A2Y33_07465 [Spirochaetes bacterium GWF1_51_8]
MKQNMGIIDRIVRLVVAAAAGVLYFTGTVTGVWGIVLLVVGGIFIVTSILGFCPLYLPFGISTKKAAK